MNEQTPKVIRYNANQPSPPPLGFAISYTCVHGQVYTIAANSIENLNPNEFTTHCDCSPLARLEVKAYLKQSAPEEPKTGEISS